ncbi:MAG: polysaccharide deacetylase family protein [Phycisphaerales bacterium]|nr:polysaccharide deacetylase family protein [Phycisphaerales bacterium]
MGPTGCMTFSWDDGHPTDARVGELLDRHGLNGTFYVPMMARTGTMSIGPLRDLSRRFEMGGHTLHHLSLVRLSDRLAESEIREGKTWLEQITGQSCSMFCPPAGRYNRKHLRMIADAGFIGVRTIELLSMGFPRRAGRLVIMPTTIQARDHAPTTILRHLVKRASLRGLWTYIVRGGVAGQWEPLARRLLERTARAGGVFHLWGHSWEMESEEQWSRLERILQLMGQFKDRLPCLTNGEICRRWGDSAATMRKQQNLVGFAPPI